MQRVFHEYYVSCVTLVLCFVSSMANRDEYTHSLRDVVNDSLSSDAEGNSEPSEALLFPFFCHILGIFSFYFMSRYVKDLPYTVVLFVIGTAMGVILRFTNNDNYLGTSMLQWVEIDSELLLAGFLPGLLFGDALGIDFHLFSISFFQILILAFPMVLLGTVLTALVGFYILPYGWSWNLSLMFGAILAATDPVSVNALLKEVGAPPSLCMLVSGER